MKNKSLNISTRSFLTAIAVIFVLMVVAYALTLVIPGGMYARIPNENGNMINLYPGIPYELSWEIYDGKEYQVAKYNFGKEIMCDVSTGNCYKIEDSLLPYVTPEVETGNGEAQ